MPFSHLLILLIKQHVQQDVPPDRQKNGLPGELSLLKAAHPERHDRSCQSCQIIFFCRHPIDALGFAPSQVRKAIPGTLLDHILKNGIQITHKNTDFYPLSKVRPI